MMTPRAKAFLNGVIMDGWNTQPSAQISLTREPYGTQVDLTDHRTRSAGAYVADDDLGTKPRQKGLETFCAVLKEIQDDD